MLKTREILRLKHEVGLSLREIGQSCNCGKSTVSEILERAEKAGISLPIDLIAPDKCPDASGLLSGYAGICMIGGKPLSAIKNLDRKDRDALLQKIKSIEGTTHRQIARILDLAPSILFKAFPCFQKRTNLVFNLAGFALFFALYFGNFTNGFNHLFNRDRLHTFAKSTTIFKAQA